MLIPISLFRCWISVFLSLASALHPFILSFSVDGGLDAVWSLGVSPCSILLELRGQEAETI